MRRRYCWWGLYVSLAMLMAITIAALVPIAMAYDGQCGSFMPFLGGPRPCSLWEHLSREAGLLFFVFLGYWPLVLALLILPAWIGYMFDRHARDR